MQSDTIHMIYRTGGSTAHTYYMILDFNQDTAQSTLMYTDIFGTNEAFFVGSKTEFVGDIEVH